MIGSPDLLAFTGTEGFGEGELDQEDLPEELSVPLSPPSNPWTSSAQFHRDFILVAEFSEQVGPKPVLTIPDDPRVIGSFDLNHFSVRIMSVDYQASGPSHAPPASPGPRLNFSEDSKVVLGDSAEDAFAYVHHMTLYDLEARGMVRPFCMAYVCSDQKKLMENFSELSTCFSQASDSLKTGNRQAFSMELQRKLQELAYRRLTLLQKTEVQRMPDGSTEEGETAEELEAVERSILIHRDLLRQVTSYPNRKLKQPDFLPYDPADSVTDPTALLPPEPCPSLSTSTSCRSERRLKPLHELCNAYFLSLTKEQLADTERRLRGDRSVLRTATVTRSLSRRLTLVNFLFELWSPEDGDEEERESAESELQKTTGSKSGLEMFQSEPVSLDSFFSCVEEIPIKLEAGEAGTVTPDLNVAPEMTGSMSSGDSIEVLGTEKSYRTQHVVAGSDSRETPVGMTDNSYRRATVDSGVRHVRAYARRANSEDSIEVLSTTESIFPDDLTAITEEEAEHHLLSNGVEKDQAMPTEWESNDALEERKTPNANTSANADENKEPVRDDDSLGDRDETLKQTTVNGEIKIKEEQFVECLKSNQVCDDNCPEKTSKLLQVEEAAESTPQWSEVRQKVQLVPELHVDLAPPVAVAEADSWPPPCGPLRLPSVDEASDCTSFTGSSDPPSPTQNIHSNSRSNPRRRRKAGLRALRFLKQNSFSQHAVFCLLSGRPLVVIGGDESSVTKLLDALSLFLPAPGPDGNAVMPCLTTPLQLTDLLTWRLIGIHRSSSSSSATILLSLTRYSRYLALLDLDQRTLRCPSYSGSLIGRLANPYAGIRRGITYLLHLESCLTALANQALLYTFKTALQRPNTAGGNDGTEGEDFLVTRGFCSSECDLRVMHFLCDLIKQRHTGRGPPVLSFSYNSMHLHRNTFAA
ncbi:guanine nucleotide exchange protein smcr8b [Etheostoma cragini]|uniref:guanine nucleotide exchange protein smcr8b n=1 Tax=Etheostoma cragini TaxID=417921 RepID=UPI00155F35D4|nr:guanine nucleotide exchange protein smcr8b [Etheostoma cragini]